MPGWFKVLAVTKEVLEGSVRVFAELACGGNAVFPWPGESTGWCPCATSAVDGEELSLLVIELFPPLCKDGVRLGRDVHFCVPFTVIPRVRDSGEK